MKSIDIQQIIKDSFAELYSFKVLCKRGVIIPIPEERFAGSPYHYCFSSRPEILIPDDMISTFGKIVEVDNYSCDISIRGCSRDETNGGIRQNCWYYTIECFKR